jgi:hypothetical protein
MCLHAITRLILAECIRFQGRAVVVFHYLGTPCVFVGGTPIDLPVESGLRDPALPYRLPVRTPTL